MVAKFGNNLTSVAKKEIFVLQALDNTLSVLYHISQMFSL